MKTISKLILAIVVLFISVELYAQSGNAPSLSGVESQFSNSVRSLIRMAGWACAAAAAISAIFITWKLYNNEPAGKTAVIGLVGGLAVWALVFSIV